MEAGYHRNIAIGDAICTLLSIKPTRRLSMLGVAASCISLTNSADGTDANDTTVGMHLIRDLELRVKANGRVDTDGGDKTPMGLTRTIIRVIEENN